MTKIIRTLIKLSLYFFPLLLSAEETLDSSINSFAFHFYQETLSSSNKNELFSPFCLFHGISMAYIGSQGETEKEIKKALYLDLPQKECAKVLNTLSHSLLPSTLEKPFVLNIASSLWINKNTSILPSYQDLIQIDLEAHVESLSFSDGALSAAIINHWVKEQTRNTIQKLLSPQDILKKAQLMLVSTIYFKGSWAKPFNKRLTEKAPFYTNQNSNIYKITSMMHQTGSFPYYENDEVELLLLPFTGKSQSDGTLACFFLLPKKSLESLQNLPLAHLISLTQTEKIEVSIPRFTLHPRYDLVPMLSKIGIHKAFSSAADFSNINGRFDLLINKAIHEAFFALDEYGVTASAATAIGLGYSCVYNPKKNILFEANRPFLFGIVDLKSNVVLFLGKMIEP